MKRNIIFSLLSLIVLCWSCQQEVDFSPEGPGPVPMPVNDSSYLTMIVTIDTLAPAGLDTIYKHVYSYDAQKRLVRARAYEYQSGIQRPIITEERRYYKGNDTLPYMYSMIYDNVPSTLEVDSVFLTWQNGVVVKDSTRGYLDDGSLYAIYVTTISQLSNTNYLVKRVDLSNPGYIDSILSTRIWNNGNLVSGKDSVWAFYAPGLEVYEYQHQYDNKPDPLSPIALPYMVSNDEIALGPEDFLTNGYKSRNNIIKLTGSLSGPLIGNNPFTAEWFYEYRADGYPVVSRYAEYAPDAKRIYIYSRL